jgi:putative peptidoglycan lipid II flippase
MSESKIFKNSAYMALGTIISRITGVLRSAAIIAAIGFGPFADAYSIANSLPTIIYIVIIGGAINSIFVPQLVKHQKNDLDEGKSFSDKLLTFVIIILLSLGAIAVLMAPLIIKVYSPDNWTQENFEVSVLFARFLLPQIFFYGLFAVLQQVLNARGHFAFPMYAPIANNLVVTITALLFLKVAINPPVAGMVSTSAIYLLAVGTTLGIAVQALVLIPVLKKVNYQFKFNFAFKNSGLGLASKLAIWTFGYVVVNQLTYVLITRLAAGANVSESDIGFTAYQNAYLIFMLPHSIIAVSLVTALLPRFSNLATEQSKNDLVLEIRRSINTLLFLLLPIAALLASLAPSATALLFARGSASLENSISTGFVLSAFLIGLVPFSIFYLLLRGFYALDDTKTPFVFNIFLNLIHIAAAVLLYSNLAGSGRIVGLALSLVVSYLLITPIMYFWLLKKIEIKTKYDVAPIKIIISALLLIIALAVLNHFYNFYLPGESFLSTLFNILLVGIFGTFVYLFLSFIFRVKELKYLSRLFK